MSSPSRILFLNRSYWPDTEATGQLLTELAEDLSHRFDVHVLAGQPNHATTEGFSATGSQVHQGVTIHRVRHTQYSKSSRAGKLANLMSFSVAAARQGRRLPRPDVIVAQTDPFFLPLVARRLSRGWRCRMVVTLQDIYPDVIVGLGMLREGIIARTIRNALRRAYGHADRIVVLSEDMQERCLRWGVPADKLRIVRNWSDAARVRPHKTDNPFRREHGLQDAFVVMYSGNMGHAHLLEPLLRAAARLRPRSDIRFLFVGEGVQKRPLEEQAQRLGLHNVRFLPYQPRETLGESLSAADVHFVSVHPGVADCLMPSKLYGILAAGTPVIALCPSQSELARCVVEHDVGIVCSTDGGGKDGCGGCAVDELVAAIESMAGDAAGTRRRGLAARHAAETCYDRSIQTGRFAEMLDEVLGTGVRNVAGAGAGGRDEISSPRAHTAEPILASGER